jgi:membrane-bound inhibitor of C-type lysozyme
MRLRSFALALPLVIATAPALAEPVAFACDDGQEIMVDLGDKAAAKVTRGDKSWTLPATVTDSGTSFVTEGVEFWSEGNEAILTVDGVTSQCLLRPAAE